MLEYKQGVIPEQEQLLALYADAGWTAYTDDPERLEQAAAGSLAIYTVWEKNRLIGLLRAVGDGETILYVQDILVLQAYRRRGIGRTLLERVTADYGYIRQKVLSTDDTGETKAFYRSCGWHPVGELGCVTFMKV